MLILKSGAQLMVGYRCTQCGGTGGPVPAVKEIWETNARMINCRCSSGWCCRPATDEEIVEMSRYLPVAIENILKKEPDVQR